MNAGALRVVVVDDEPLSVRRMQRALEGLPDVEVVGTAGDGIEAAGLIARLKPDLVFLDIRMPGLSGLDLAKSFAGDGSPLIVFVSAFDRFAVRAFEVAAVDYLLKPAPLDRLGEAVARARRRLAESETLRNYGELQQVVSALRAERDADAGAAPDAGEIWITHTLGRARLPAAEILRAEAERDYVRIHARDRSYLIRGPLHALACKLDPARFARVHRSALVQLDAVQEVVRSGAGGLVLVLEGGDRVPVGRTYAAGVLGLLGAARPQRARDAGRG